MTEIKIPNDQVQIFFEGANCSYIISAEHVLNALKEYLERTEQVKVKTTYTRNENY